MSKITDIRKFAEKSAKKKLTLQRQELVEKTKKDEAIIEKIIDYVNSGLVYKEVGDNWNKKYVVVTEDILFDDFTGEPRTSWDSKTMIGRESNYKSRLVVKVNGYSYYHVGDLFERHLENINDAIQKSSLEVDQLVRKREVVKNLQNNEKALKNILLNYQISLDKAEEL